MVNPVLSTKKIIKKQLLAMAKNSTREIRGKDWYRKVGGNCII